MSVFGSQAGADDAAVCESWVLGTGDELLHIWTNLLRARNGCLDLTAKDKRLCKRIDERFALVCWSAEFSVDVAVSHKYLILALERDAVVSERAADLLNSLFTEAFDAEEILFLLADESADGSDVCFSKGVFSSS